MKKIAASLIIPLLLLITVPCHVLAEGEISTTCYTDNNFPNALIFHIEAESDTDISRIMLRYRVHQISQFKITSLVDKKFDPAPLVKTQWQWDMREASLPPGAEVEYSWLVENAAGNQTETVWQVVEFTDNHHDWNSLRDGNVTLYWYYGSSAFSLELMDAAHQALDRLYNDTGSKLGQSVELYTYASNRDMLNAMMHPQEWTGGAAYCPYGIVVLGISPEDLSWGKRSLTHELAHLVTYQMTLNPYNDIPTWLNEGLSKYAEGRLEPALTEALNKAIDKDEIFSTLTLSGNQPASYDEAILFYAESYSIVRFLIENYGREKMLALLDTFQQGSSYDNALEQVYGFDTTGLDDIWRESLGLMPRPNPTLYYANQTTPTTSPPIDLIGCGSASGDTGTGRAVIFGAAGLLLLPGIGEIIRLRRRRG